MPILCFMAPHTQRDNRSIEHRESCRCLNHLVSPRQQKSAVRYCTCLSMAGSPPMCGPFRLPFQRLARRPTDTPSMDRTTSHHPPHFVRLFPSSSSSSSSFQCAPPPPPPKRGGGGRGHPSLKYSEGGRAGTRLVHPVSAPLAPYPPNSFVLPPSVACRVAHPQPRRTRPPLTLAPLSLCFSLFSLSLSARSLLALRSCFASLRFACHYHI